ncbi:MAG: acetate kinase, partial [Actinomycetota bacterium]|nr:acetate kinase [Actinomycetota bacterium]
MSVIFVVNTGSSSIKYQLIDVDSEQVLASGLLERIGEPGSEYPDHESGLRAVLGRLDPGIEIRAVGHRVVHGGDRFSGPTVIDDGVVRAIEEVSV